MTSEIPFISKILLKYDHTLHEYASSNDPLPNRLLSPITENSVEILQTSISTNKTSSADTSQKSPNIVLSNDEHNHIYLQRFLQYTTNFQTIQNYLDKLHQHFKALSIIIEYIRHDQNLLDIIEPIETRLLQMRAKRDQIDHLLNQSSIKHIMQQISPYIFKSNLNIDYQELLNSIQLSMNQKSTLIDHIKNEYRYKKYQINEYSSKLQQRRELLIKLTNQIEQFLIQHNRIFKQINRISIINEHNRQSIELTNLSNEYEQLKNENHLLTLKAKENIEKFSIFMQSNHRQ
ncbi:unnamed protein product [Adineta steineri]|uniref:Uncharacterized protein n=1 Tax=Adineta steineri TaxID=433720 RepID=A0A814ABE3_9BILA|nr:unnamed protein product [Adineta steineri]CAF3532712.1 unnamed protein product [Adineta steineri]